MGSELSYFIRGLQAHGQAGYGLGLAGLGRSEQWHFTFSQMII
jgi:hypothetical protein